MLALESWFLSRQFSLGQEGIQCLLPLIRSRASGGKAAIVLLFGGLEFLDASMGAVIAAASVATELSSSLLVVALTHFNSNT